MRTPSQARADLEAVAERLRRKLRRPEAATAETDGDTDLATPAATPAAAAVQNAPTPQTSDGGGEHFHLHLVAEAVDYVLQLLP